MVKKFLTKTFFKAYFIMTQKIFSIKIWGYRNFFGLIEKIWLMMRFFLNFFFKYVARNLYCVFAFEFKKIFLPSWSLVGREVSK